MGMMLQRHEEFEDDGRPVVVVENKKQLQHQHQQKKHNKNQHELKRRRNNTGGVGGFLFHNYQLRRRVQDIDNSNSSNNNNKTKTRGSKNMKHTESNITESLSSTRHQPKTTDTVSNRTIVLRQAHERRGTYTGQFDSTLEKPHGHGTMIYDDGCIYEGQWYDGDWSGLGSYYCNHAKATYDGPFLDNRKHGVFVVRYKDGRTYDGSFHLNKMLRGYMDLPNLGRYYGDFDTMEQPHGRGKLSFDDGRQYDGEFVHGQIDGHGRMIYGNLSPAKSSSSSDNNDNSNSRDCAIDIDVSGDTSAYTTDTDSSNHSHFSIIDTMDDSGKSTLQHYSSSDYSFYLGSFSNGKRYGEGVLMIDEEIIHDGHWYDDEPVESATSSPVPGVAEWIPSNNKKKRQRCLGRIPPGIKPHSRFSNKKKTTKTEKKKNKNNKKPKTTRRARHLLDAGQ